MTSRPVQRKASSTTSDIALVAVFTALVIVLGFVYVPVGVLGVPILLQNTAVILAALILGPRRGFMVTALFLLIGTFLPVLAGGRTTIFALGGATVGYIIGYLIAVPVAGLIAKAAVGKPKGTAIAVFALGGYLGVAIQYIAGAGGMIVRTGMASHAALAAQLPFIPTDAFEMAVMVAIASGVHTAFPHLLRGEIRH
ncbi:biotin transporter BioY [Corynebacterium mayonis]|uniref:biotin transporter BioY n=1 Tax=Corynebacterium mayonis TaxID=3062461 RepID=UPI003140433F